MTRVVIGPEKRSRRLRLGRLAIYFEPRDLWIGAYISYDAVYVCPLPVLVLRWTRRPR